jgi:hypothetical protein
VDAADASPATADDGRSSAPTPTRPPVPPDVALRIAKQVRAERANLAFEPEFLAKNPGSRPFPYPEHYGEVPIWARDAVEPLIAELDAAAKQPHGQDGDGADIREALKNLSDALMAAANAGPYLGYPPGPESRESALHGPEEGDYGLGGGLDTAVRLGDLLGPGGLAGPGRAAAGPAADPEPETPSDAL